MADFGIALAASKAGSTRMTETGMSLGTPHYMSPEQAMGEREIGPRSDVYALGAITYEMLAGDPPFLGSTAQAIVAKVITEKALPLTAARDTVPPAVAAAVHQALAKLPADRFASAAEFAAALVGRMPPGTDSGAPATTVGPLSHAIRRGLSGPPSPGPSSRSRSWASPDCSCAGGRAGGRPESRSGSPSSFPRRTAFRAATRCRPSRRTAGDSLSR